MRPHFPLLLVMVVAAWLRLWQLWGDPLYGDEAEYAIVARDLARDPWALDYPPLEGFGPSAFVSQPPLLLYLMAVSMRLLGPTDLAAALPSALLGLATVLVVYVLAKEIAGPRAALVAAGLLAVHPFHIEMSRQAMLDAGFVFFVCLTTLALTWWWRSGRMRHGLLASVAATCAALSKLPGIVACVAVAVVALAMLARAWTRPRPGGARIAAQAPLLLVPPALGAAAYLGLLRRIDGIDDLVRKLRWQAERIAGPGMDPSVDPLSSAKPLAFYLSDADNGVLPLLGAATLAAALVGLAWAAYRLRRDSRAVPVLVMLCAYSVFLVASARREGFYLLPLAPLACILVGAAAAWATSARSTCRSTRARSVALVAALLAFAPTYAAAADSYVRFGPGQDPSHPPMGSGIEDAARLVQGDRDVGVYGTALGRFSLYWYTEQPTYHWYNGLDELESAIDRGRLRYLVYDDYLEVPHERALIDRLVTERDASQIARLPVAAPHITVYRVEGDP